MEAYSCAKRAADPNNEFAACRHWCGDMACVGSTVDREVVRKYIETFEKMARQGGEWPSFESMGWSRTPELTAAESIWRACKGASNKAEYERSKREAFARLRAKFSTSDPDEAVLYEEEEQSRGAAG